MQSVSRVDFASVSSTCVMVHCLAKRTFFLLYIVLSYFRNTDVIIFPNNSSTLGKISRLLSIQITSHLTLECCGRPKFPPLLHSKAKQRSGSLSSMILNFWPFWRRFSAVLPTHLITDLILECSCGSKFQSLLKIDAKILWKSPKQFKKGLTVVNTLLFLVLYKQTRYRRVPLIFSRFKLSTATSLYGFPKWYCGFYYVFFSGVNISFGQLDYFGINKPYQVKPWMDWCFFKTHK